VLGDESSDEGGVTPSVDRLRLSDGVGEGEDMAVRGRVYARTRSEEHVVVPHASDRRITGEVSTIPSPELQRNSDLPSAVARNASRNHVELL
jgi:hypothetical protein